MTMHQMHQLVATRAWYRDDTTGRERKARARAAARHPKPGRSAPAPEPRTTAGAGGLEMLIGTLAAAALILALVIASGGPWALSLLDAAYFAVVAGIAAVRHVDLRRAAEASRGSFKRFALVLGGVARWVWIAAQSAYALH
jgi:hypothetical protein